MAEPLTFGGQRVLPVVTIERDAAALAGALAAAGARVAEITFRSDYALEAIETLAAAGLAVGAGTVRSPAQVDAAASAGAAFVVSPGLDRPVVERAAARGIPALPGVATASELSAALALGVEVVKLFPAEVVGGVDLIRALAAPFPEARFVPTGGLNSANGPSYLELPQVVAIGGSWMVAPHLLRDGRWDDVERLTREALAL